MSLSWRSRGEADVYLHSFLTSALDEWLASRAGCFNPEKPLGAN